MLLHPYAYYMLESRINISTLHRKERRVNWTKKLNISYWHNDCWLLSYRIWQRRLLRQYIFKSRLVIDVYFIGFTLWLSFSQTWQLYAFFCLTIWVYKSWDCKLGISAVRVWVIRTTMAFKVCWQDLLPLFQICVVRNSMQ